jgi:hypothetical protein
LLEKFPVRDRAISGSLAEYAAFIGAFDGRPPGRTAKFPEKFPVFRE